jgi:hypothetical protein
MDYWKYPKVGGLFFGVKNLPLGYKKKGGGATCKKKKFWKKKAYHILKGKKKES